MDILRSYKAFVFEEFKVSNADLCPNCISFEYEVQQEFYDERNKEWKKVEFTFVKVNPASMSVHALKVSDALKSKSGEILELSLDQVQKMTSAKIYNVIVFNPWHKDSRVGKHRLNLIARKKYGNEDLTGFKVIQPIQYG